MAISWSDEQYARVEAAVANAPTASYEEYASAFREAGIPIENPEAVRRVLRDLNLGTRADRQSFALERQHANIQGGLYATAPRRRSYFQKVEQACGEWAEEYAPQLLYTLDFSDATKPIALVHSSDWHGGLKSVDYPRLRADNALVEETEGAYMVAAGDLIDNTKPQRKSAGSLYVTAMGPDEQWEWLEDATYELRQRDKIVSVIVGNHEHWDTNEAGINTMRRWCKYNGLPYHGHGGVFKVLVGQQTYYAILRHEYIGGSGKNKTLGPINMYERFPRAREAAHLDWTYTGHLHFSLQYPADHAAGECHHLRGGSYQQFSDWVDQKVGVQRTKSGCPTVILYPHEHRVESRKGTELPQAMEWLTYKRSAA